MTIEEVGLWYERAVQSFTDKVKLDPSVLAVVAFGSFAYDTVWEKSDVDLSVILREQAVTTRSYTILEDGININADIQTMSEFKRGFEKSIGGSFSHSYYSRGRILFTRDDSLYEYLDEMKRFGSNDIELALFRHTGQMIGTMEKIEKWLRVKKDTMYARYYVIKAAESIAYMEICKRGELPTREVLLAANKISPDLIKTFYHDPISREMTEDEIFDLLRQMDAYMVSNLELIKKPIVEFMQDGEVKTMTMICNYFRLSAHELSHAFDFLCDKGVVEKVSETIRITKKGKQLIDEVAFIYIDKGEGN